jgi:hypothetical protein
MDRKTVSMEILAESDGLDHLDGQRNIAIEISFTAGMAGSSFLWNS